MHGKRLGQSLSIMICLGGASLSLQDNKRNAPEFWSILGGSWSRLSPVIANVAIANLWVGDGHWHMFHTIAR
jgi:hypothetical protein